MVEATHPRSLDQLPIGWATGIRGGKAMKDHNLVTELQCELLRVIRELIDTGHYPVRLLSMLGHHGPVITAVHFVMAQRDPEGFESLIVSRRMDLTVEAIILQEPFRPLFVPEVLERAEQKLREVGYLV